MLMVVQLAAQKLIGGNCIMATNPPKGDGHRNGAVRDRTQTYNPKNEKWVKRDSETGRFMDVKSDGMTCPQKLSK